MTHSQAPSLCRTHDRNRSADPRIDDIEIGHGIAWGGLGIAAGDLLIADQDGVLAVPRTVAEEILGLAKEKFKLEQSWEVDIAASKWTAAGWTRRSRNCSRDDGPAKSS